MVDGPFARTDAPASSFSSASLPVCGRRRSMSARYTPNTFSRGSCASNLSSTPGSIFRISGSMNDVSAPRSAPSCTISCCMPWYLLTRVSWSDIMLAYTNVRASVFCRSAESSSASASLAGLLASAPLNSRILGSDAASFSFASLHASSLG